VKIADMLLRGLARLALGLLHLAWWGLSYPLVDLVALVLVAVLFWRFNLGARAMERNRARAMRWRSRCRLRPGPGFASLAELGTQWSRIAAAHRGGRARPGLTWIQRMVATAATGYALRLGRAQWGKRVFGSMEANWLLIAPPRKHKSGMLADWILDWPGAAIATSTRADLFSLTAGRRWRHGPVFVFNPYQVGEVPSTFGWDVVAGCADPAEAFLRADAIIGPRTMAAGDMAWWQDKAAIALAALLHAAALSGRTVLDIWDWANREGDAAGGSALARHPAASRQLRSVFAEATRDGRSPDSIRMTMAKSLTWVADPAVAAMVHGPAAGPFDADTFAASGGTLYMIAAGAAGATIGPLFRCFTDYVQRAASLSGSRRPAGKLDPPLLLALDEARQIVRVPLEVWLADSAGKGITIVAVAHGLGQLREGWGPDGAATIWDTTNKIIMPGVTDADCLDAVSGVCGTVAATEGDRRVQVPAVPPAFVRRLPRRRALILEADLAPVVVKIRPAWARLAARLRLHAAPPDLDAALDAAWEPEIPAPDWPTTAPDLGGVLAGLPGHQDGQGPAA
jgi:type IV secretion system protein VirD4